MKPTEDLLERCKKDDRKAHYELYTQCFPFLISVCRRYYINREDLQSALNQVFLKIIRNLGSYTKKMKRVPFELWIRRIAINHAVDEFRKNFSHRETIEFRDALEAEDASHSSDPFAERERLEEIQAAVDRLSEMNRTVFNLFVVDGYGHEEIAKMLKISSGTSKAHLHNAKKKLREALNGEWKKKVITNNVYS